MKQQNWPAKPLQPLRILQRKELSPECFIYQVIWKGLALSQFTWQTEQLMEMKHQEMLELYLTRKGLSRGKQIKAQEQFHSSYDLTGVEIQQQEEFDCLSEYKLCNELYDEDEMEGKETSKHVSTNQRAKSQRRRLRNRRKNNCRTERIFGENLKEKDFCICLSSMKSKELKIISARKNEEDGIQFLVCDGQGKRIIGNEEMRKLYGQVLLDYYETKIRW